MPVLFVSVHMVFCCLAALEHGVTSKAADVYSFGVLLWQVGCLVLHLNGGLCIPPPFHWHVHYMSSRSMSDSELAE